MLGEGGKRPGLLWVNDAVMRIHPIFRTPDGFLVGSPFRGLQKLEPENVYPPKQTTPKSRSVNDGSEGNDMALSLICKRGVAHLHQLSFGATLKICCGLRNPACWTTEATSYLSSVCV